MTAAQLVAWADLEQRRRRAAARGLAALPASARAAILGALLAAEVARRAASSGLAAVEGASQLWFAVAIAAVAVATFGAPFRMYWRPDSALLAQLPLSGDVLYRLALLRSARAAAVAAVPCLLGALGFAIVGELDLALRHAGLILAAAAAAAAIGPAAALFAGALIASDAAMAAVQSFGGESGAPRTTWLGLFPGVAAAALGAALMAAGPWVAGADASAIGPPALLLALLVLGPAALLAVSIRLAPRAMVAAVREVAALDRERLAHVELTQPSALERAWAAVVRPGGRSLYLKDQRLARRRFPAPYFLMAVATVGLWIVAATGPDAYLSWFGTLVGLLAAYVVIMARRAVAPPIELPRLLHTLAIAPADVRDAKRKHLLLRVLVALVVGTVPAVLRAPEPVATGIVAAAAILATAALGALASGDAARRE